MLKDWIIEREGESLVKLLEQISDWVDRLERILAIPIAVGFIMVVFFGVMMRYVFRTPIITSIELARIGFVWSVFLGAAICVKQEKHIQFVFLFERFSDLGKKVIKLCISMLAAGFFLFLVLKGIQMVQAVQDTYFPALGWSQHWLYLPLPVSATFMLVHAVSFLARDINNLSGNQNSEVKS